MVPVRVRSFLLLLGELLYGAREVHPHERLLPDDPRVVPGTYHVHVPRPYLLLRPVVVHHVHLPRDDVPRVLHLAARGLGDGLYGLGPLPPRLQGHPPGGEFVDVGYVQLAVLEGAGFVRGIQALRFTFSDAAIR